MTTTACDLPVLEEVTELAGLLDALRLADRAIATAIDHLVQLRATGLAEAATGVGPDTWLATAARRTGADRRMLLTAADTCRRLPHVHAAFSAGELSWAQLRHLVLQVHRLPTDRDAELDTALVGAIADLAEVEPDALGRTVRWILVDLYPDPPTVERPVEERLLLQPRLDGSGGTVIGELGPVGFAALDVATAPTPADPLSPLTQRAQRLTDLCLDASGDGPRSTGRGGPELLLRTELETLIGANDRPGQLLTTLAGGAMWVDAPTARQLAGRAPSLRLIVTDRGAPVGVGRRSRSATDWLRDTILALHDTCSRPGCTSSALTSQLDHAQPWSSGGRTDVGELAPLCQPHNLRKERDGWQVTQRPDGRRTWVHRRSGLRTAAVASGRPPPPPPDG